MASSENDDRTEIDSPVQERHADLLKAEPGQISFRIEIVPSEWANDGELYHCGVGSPREARAALIEAMANIDGWIHTLDLDAQKRVTAWADQRAQEAQEPTPEQVAEKRERHDQVNREHMSQARNPLVPQDVVSRIKRDMHNLVSRVVTVKVDGEEVRLEARSYNALEILDATEALRHMTSESYDLYYIERASGYPQAAMFSRGVPMRDQEFVSVLRIGEMR